jgi:hypothetical protein
MDATAVVFLGASIFRRHTASSSYSFRRSKRDFEDCLKRPAPQGLGLRSDAFLDLFDARSAPETQLDEIGSFVRGFLKDHGDCAARNLIIYYVGPGRVVKGQLFLMLADTDTRKVDSTGLRVASLRNVLDEAARQIRLFYLLDCCFPGDALRGLADGATVAQLATDALRASAPREHSDQLRWGSALLCAASPCEPTQAHAEASRTLFSDALVEVMARGDGRLPRLFTLADMWDLTSAHVRQHQAEESRIRTFLESPDQTDGDIARSIALFPNPALQTEETSSHDRRADPRLQQQKRRERLQEEAELHEMRLQELIQVRQERDLQARQLAQGREEIEQQSKLAEQRLQRIAELDSGLAQLREQLEEQRKTAEERGQQIVELLREVERLNAELEKQHAKTLRPREPGRDANAEQDRLIDRAGSRGLIHRLRSSLSWMMIAALGVIALVVVALWRLIRLV